ncbi:2Fe-2S iron-sulfur cluster-binding protein [Shewanella psychrotolerans]|uniref:2Fe-2S iron-sulfur cluster-binding protein n=1 Tax=Shewanella psychrotolerans TaxID=2864206 RepID=UPI001C661D6F|nr:2Fe-2S iron-sulfur cluster-binding protein [Shewanella psychrotolerans]QYK00188.1 2Fe-2S iron-sulfur cluster binding domain-containing protein [Shewanella psychrotolerans]
MTVFYLDGQAFESKSQETVLDALIRHGQRLNYSCKKGVCKTCLVQQVKGDIVVGSQRGLTLALKKRNYICACQCRPSEDLTLRSILPQDLFIGATIQQKTVLSDSIVGIGLKLDEAIRHQPGQYINLRRFDGLTRSYSPTNISGASLLELHVRRKYNGQFSDWLYHYASIGEQLLVQGPLGSRHYKSDFTADKLIIIAFGSGLGVAHGIINQALAEGHQGEIFLYVGVQNEADLYLHSQLLKMMLEYSQFSYQACITGNANPRKLGRRIMLGDPFSEAINVHQFDRQQQLFICGEPTAVNQSRERAFLNGYPIERVHALSFEYKDLRARARE